VESDAFVLMLALLRQTAHNSFRRRRRLELARNHFVAQNGCRSGDVQISIADSDSGCSLITEPLDDVELADSLGIAKSDDGPVFRTLKRHINVAIRSYGDMPQCSEIFPNDESAEAGGQLNAVIVRITGGKCRGVNLHDSGEHDNRQQDTFNKPHRIP